MVTLHCQVSKNPGCGGRRYNLVLDIAGNATLSRLRRALTPTGTAVITGGEEGGSFSGGMNRQLSAVAMPPFLRQRLTTFIAKGRSSDLERLTLLIEAGNVTPSIDRSYPSRKHQTRSATSRPARFEERSRSASKRPIRAKPHPVSHPIDAMITIDRLTKKYGTTLRSMTT